MKYFYTSLIPIMLFHVAHAQDCSKIYQSAVQLFKDDLYDLALKKLAAYKLCNPDKAAKADSLIIKIYNTVNQQRADAIRQRNIANERASVIKRQKDSIEKENIANMAATQALQVNELDPNKALEFIYSGLCFSPGNRSLLEIRRRILLNEVLRKDLEGASSFSTVCIEPFNSELLVTADTDGFLRFWQRSDNMLHSKLQIFETRIFKIHVASQNYILASGNDSKDHRVKRYKLKLVDISANKIYEIQTDSNTIYKSMGSIGDTMYVGNDKGALQQLNVRNRSLTTIKNDSAGIIDIQCWEAARKIYYATPYGVYDLNTGKTIYTSPKDAFITYLGFCKSTADFYIGMGSNLVLYSLVKQTDQLLYPIHSGMISSCKCAEDEGGFISTGLDGYAVLWTSGGSVKKVLKGSRAEIYDLYLQPQSLLAITVGSREMTTGNADTGTIKSWHLKGFLNKTVKEAHFMGAAAVVFAPRYNCFFSGGNDGRIKVWDSKMDLRGSHLIDKAGISALDWDDNTGILSFGTFSGMTGSVKFDSINSAGKPRSIKTHYRHTTSIQINSGKIYSAGKDGAIYIQTTDNKPIDSLYFDAEIQSIRFSENKKQLLITAANNVIVYNLASGKKKIFPHGIRVNAAGWISDTRFVTISGQFLRIFDLASDVPVLKINNNVRNEMTALYVDRTNKLLYTGTWSGYMICWDFSGNQLFEMDQLTSLANTNPILCITSNADRSKIITADYNGTIGSFNSPLLFMKNTLRITADCDRLKTVLSK